MHPLDVSLVNTQIVPYFKHFSFPSRLSLPPLNLLCPLFRMKMRFFLNFVLSLLDEHLCSREPPLRSLFRFIPYDPAGPFSFPSFSQNQSYNRMDRAFTEV